MMTTAFDQLSDEFKWRIDEICREFEDTRYDETPPPLSDFIHRTPSELQVDTLRELLAIDFELRLRKDAEIPVAEYLSDFPAHTELINSAYEEAVQANSVRRSKLSNAQNAEPKRLGDYLLVREIGRGGMGVVYEAVQESLKRTVALKVLPPNPMSDGAGEKRFERESVAIARLHHSHIVDVFGRGEHDGVLYFAMRFVAGVGLNVLVNQAIEQRSIAVVPQQNGTTDFQSVAPIDGLEVRRTTIRADVSKADSTEQADESVGSSGLTRHEATVILIKKLDDDGPTRAEALPRNTSARGSASSQAATEIESPSISAVRLLAAESRATDTKQSLAPLRSAAEPRNECAALPLDVSARAQVVARVGHEIADALAYAHQQGVLHRDVKPSNILVDHDGVSWLTDFGLAKLFTGDVEADLTEYGDAVGTIRYMAPEVIQGQADARSDVFGLGLTLFELLALRPAYQHTKRQALLQDVINADVPSLANIVADAPRDLVTIIQKAVDREPQARYQTAQELADDLQRFLNDEPIHARPITLFERWRRWSRRNRALSGALVALAVLLLVIAIGASLAAGHFRTLNASLGKSVSDLNSANTELKQSTDKATQAEAAARVSAKEADRARQAAQVTLADMQVERGVQSLLQKEPATAAMWFTSAAELAAHDEHRATVNRLQARNALLAAPVTEAMWRTAPFARDMLRIGTPWHELDFLPGGQHLFARPSRGPVLFDLNKNVRVSWLDELEEVFAVCWSHDGRRLFVGFGSGEVQIRDTATGALLRSLKGVAGVGPITVSRDGRFLAGGRFSVQLWSLTDEPRVAHEWQIAGTQKLSFNHSGTRLLLQSFSDVITVVSTVESERSQIVFPKGQPLAARTVEFLNDGRQLIARRPQEKRLLWRHVETGDDATPVGLKTPFNAFTCLAVHPDQQSFAVGTEEGCYWYSIKGELTHLPQSEPVTALTFSADGRSLGVASQLGVIRQWKLGEKPELLSRHTHWDAPLQIALSADGTKTAVGDMRRLTVRRQPSERIIERQFSNWGDFNWIARPQRGSTRVSRAAWRTAMIAAPRPLALGSVSTLDVATGETIGTAITTNDTVDTCLLEDGRSIAIIDLDATSRAARLQVYDVQTGQPRGEFLQPNSNLWAITTRPGSPNFLVQLRDNSVVEIDPQTVKPTRYLPQLSPLQMSAGFLNHGRLECSPDGKSIVAVSGDSSVTVIDAVTFRPRFEALRPVISTGYLRCIAFSRDSRLLATAVDGQNAVQVWDLATGKPLCEPLLHPGDLVGIKSIAFSPDGSRIASANQDGQVRQWDWQAAALACSPTLHPGEVLSVLYSADGRFMVSASLPGVVQLADARSGTLIAPRIELPNIQRLDNLQLEWVGEKKLLVSATHPVVLDLSPLLAPVTQSHATLKADSELQSARKLEAGELRPFNGDEWQQRWSNRSSSSATQGPASDDQREMKLIEDDLVKNGAVWRPVKVTSAKSDAGATLTPQPDGSLLVSGVDRAGDRYVVTADIGVEPVASLRLEVLPDASLPTGGSGRHSSGNFKLKRLRVSMLDALPVGSDSIATNPSQQKPFDLTNVYTTFSYNGPLAPDVDPRGLIRDDLATVWHTYSRTSQPQAALVTIAPVAQPTTGQQLVIELQHHSSNELMNLGRFRLSVSSDPQAVFRAQLHLSVPHGKVSPRLFRALAQWANGASREALQTVNETPPDSEPNNIGARHFILTHAHHSLGETAQAQHHFDELLSFTQQDALPEPLRTKFVETLMTIGGRTLPEAHSEITRSELTREINRLNATSRTDPDAALIKTQLESLQSRLKSSKAN